MAILPLLNVVASGTIRALFMSGPFSNVAPPVCPKIVVEINNKLHHNIMLSE
jgi:hypothetical protein